jgi:hypothetical protein
LHHERIGLGERFSVSVPLYGVGLGERQTMPRNFATGILTAGKISPLPGTLRVSGDTDSGKVLRLYMVYYNCFSQIK